jgi:nicotinate-nucleotide pyrophosphorylase (carboxylating)
LNILSNTTSRNIINQVLPLDGVERVLCDNFSIVDLAQAVHLSNGKLPLEASGNIDENTILAVAKT